MTLPFQVTDVGMKTDRFEKFFQWTDHKCFLQPVCHFYFLFSSSKVTDNS